MHGKCYILILAKWVLNAKCHCCGKWAWCWNWACRINWFLMSLLWKLRLLWKLSYSPFIRQAQFPQQVQFPQQTQFPQQWHQEGSLSTAGSISTRGSISTASSISTSVTLKSAILFLFDLKKVHVILGKKDSQILPSLRESILKSIHFYIITRTRERKFSGAQFPQHRCGKWACCIKRDPTLYIVMLYIFCNITATK